MEPKYHLSVYTSNKTLLDGHLGQYLSINNFIELNACRAMGFGFHVFVLQIIAKYYWKVASAKSFASRDIRNNRCTNKKKTDIESGKRLPMHLTLFQTFH